ncbi:MAG TPA: hypothetical protein VHY08_18335 [Bacillota bacterium]|nr:hypothetical protein [Bacillota bacterium]
MGAEWIFHQGKKILYINYTGLSIPEQLDLIREATQILLDSASQENLTLTDVRGITVSSEFVDLAKEMGAKSGPVTKKAAILGVEGLKKVILYGVNKFSGNIRKPFDTIEEAKDWLVE